MNMPQRKLAVNFQPLAGSKKPVLREGAGRDEYGIFEIGERVTREGRCAAGSAGIRRQEHM
jgi:hypothetical protein